MEHHQYTWDWTKPFLLVAAFLICLAIPMQEKLQQCSMTVQIRSAMVFSILVQFLSFFLSDYNGDWMAIGNRSIDSAATLSIRIAAVFFLPFCCLLWRGTD